MDQTPHMVIVASINLEFIKVWLVAVKFIKVDLDRPTRFSPELKKKRPANTLYGDTL